jgi:hypothetical protein
MADQSTDDPGFDPRRIEFEYPLWVVALNRAGGPVPDEVAPDDPEVNYAGGIAGETGRCLIIFTDEPAAEHFVKGLNLSGTRLMRLPSALDFLDLLRALAGRGYNGAVFDPLHTNKKAFPVQLTELIDDTERRTGG